jgi:hypothetical protein
MIDPGIDSLAVLQERTNRYFEREVNPDNGLVRDNTYTNAPASIAGSGMALACGVVAVERGYVSRPVAAARAATALGFLYEAEQSDRPTATGYKGFFYHFLDMQSGQRTWRSELSTIDSAILFAGALTAAQFFDGPSADERTIRELAEAVYRRADWRWMLRNGVVSHGWRPESGYLRYDWRGYNEALFLMILALGSPTFGIPEESYSAWTSTYQWRRIYGHEYLYAGPLFTHQLSQLWIDFRGIQDAYMRSHGIDYFENSRRATYVQRAYAAHNPHGFKGYGEDSWAITASDGPGGPGKSVRRGGRIFWGYHARGVPYGPDDGTLSPWAIVASLPFAPDIVVSAMRYVNHTYPRTTGEYGYESSFNPSFPDGSAAGWISPWHYAIDQGPVVIMVENYLTGLIWKLTRSCEHVVHGLRRAGFMGGWLGTPHNSTSAIGGVARTLHH